MEHDSPTLLFRLACEYLISAQLIDQARRQGVTWDELAPALAVADRHGAYSLARRLELAHVARSV
jgi:hypothetical protein